MSINSFLCEIPTGMFADLVSRRLSVILGIVLCGGGFLFEILSPSFAGVLCVVLAVFWDAKGFMYPTRSAIAPLSVGRNMNQAINQNQRPLVMTGEKVALVMMVADDVETFAAWYQDLEFTKMLGTPGELQTVEMRRECFNRVGSQPNFSAVEFSLLTTASRQLIGFGGLFNMTRGIAAELFMGISRAHWRKGYGTECVRLIATYGFSYLSLNCIHLSVHSYNTGAIRCYEKAGFKQAGRLRGVLLLDGFRYDEILMDQLRDEFKSENQVQTTN